MITCLVVITIAMLHIAASWVKEKLTGSKERFIDYAEPQATAPKFKVDKLRLTNHHRLLLDMQMYRHKINQSVHTTDEALKYTTAGEAECAEIERQITKLRRQMAVDKSGLEAWMKKDKAALVSKIDNVRDYTTGYQAPQRDKLQSQVSRIKNEISLKKDEYDGLKQSIEMNKTLVEGYGKQMLELEKQIRVKSAQQVKEKAAMNNEYKVLTCHINKLEKQITTMTSCRMEVLKLEQLNLDNETVELKRAADKFKGTGVPRRHFMIARWRYYGTLTVAFVLAAVVVVFNVSLVNTA